MVMQIGEMQKQKEEPRQKLAPIGNGQLQEELHHHHLHQEVSGVGCVQMVLKVVYGRDALDVLEEFIEKVVQPI